MAQHPTERGGHGSEATDFFVIYWAMPVAAGVIPSWKGSCCRGTGIKHHDHPWSALEKWSEKWLEWEEMFIFLERWLKCLRK